MRFVKENGHHTTQEDPQRLLWYGACGFWTDDWSTLNSVRDIPCCPTCMVPGFQIRFKEWIEGAQKFEEKLNPRYVEFLLQAKGKCHRKAGFMQSYLHWLRLQELQDKADELEKKLREKK